MRLFSRNSGKTKSSKKNVLYIEDNEDTADAVKAILTNAGFNADISLCGKDGVRKAKEGFDLILIDIMLPDMSGWDIFTKLNKHINTKFAFLSAIPVSKERMEVLKNAGVSDYITKPFTKADLINRINKILK